MPNNNCQAETFCKHYLRELVSTSLPLEPGSREKPVPN